MDDNIKKIKQFAKKCLINYTCAAHSIEHVMRVYNMAIKLAKDEDVDLEVVKISALLHDIGYYNKLTNEDHAIKSAQLAELFLKKLGYKKDKIEHIKECIIAHRYRTKIKPKSLEAKIIFDADKLEIIGAIGIARAFVWIGKHNAYIYKKVDIQKYIKENLNGEINGRIQDKSKHSPQISWETKDKFVLNCLYTDKAKKIAKKRYRFTQNFYKKLEEEINGLE